MSGSRQTLNESEASPSLLAGRFAAFLKSSFIYPARNQRVTESAEAFLETLRSLSHDERWVTIRFRSAELLVDQGVVEEPGPLTEWMHETFTKASICGVDVGPGLDLETMAQFTEQVRACQSDRDAVFEKEWGDRRGLRPVALLFTGGHLERDTGDEGGADGIGHGGSSAATGYTNPFAEGSAQASLLDSIAGSNQLSGRLAEMQGKLNRQLADSRDLTQVDLLGEIIRHLPTEALASPDLASQVMDQVLDMAESEVLDALQTGDLDADAGLSSLFLGIARKFFGTTVDPDAAARVAHDLPVGRPEDLVYTADLEKLLDEMDRLPVDTSIDIEKADPLGDAEMLGVYLYSCRRTEDTDALTKLEESIDPLLENPGAEVLTVLDAYTNESIEPSPENKTAADRLVKLLKRTGRAHHFARCDLLNVDVIKFGFPQNFLLFLDSLDDSEASRKKLSDVCYGLTRERIAQEKEALFEGEGILEASRLRSLLSIRSHEVIPFVSILAQEGENRVLPKLSHLLRSLDVPAAEGAALRALEDSRLSLSYIHELCECMINGNTNKKLQEYSLYLLTQFIDDKAEDEVFHDRRMYAIGELRFFPGEGTRVYLQDLATSGRLLKRSKIAKASREAAAKTLARLGGKKS